MHPILAESRSACKRCPDWTQNRADRDEIRRRAEADFLGLYLDYGGRRRGKALFCIFHEDKTPSASIHRGRFRCWGCGKGPSDPFAFVMAAAGVDFKTALGMLADRHGVPLQHRPLTDAERHAYRRAREAAEARADVLTTRRRSTIETLRTWRNYFWDAARRADFWLRSHVEADWSNPRTLAALRCATDGQRLGDRLAEALGVLERIEPREFRELVASIAELAT